MDSFIHKYEQRKNAQEMIRANAMAEAKEREQMAARLLEYETALQEMRQCNLHTMENAEKVKELLAASLRKIEDVQKKDENIEKKPEASVEEIKALLKEIKGKITELQEEQKNQAAEFLKEKKELFDKRDAQMQEFVDAQKKALEERLGEVENFNHKEAVKVYRNVQAVIEEALPKQTEEIKEMVRNELGDVKTSGWLVAVCIMTFLAASTNAVIEVLRILGYL